MYCYEAPRTSGSAIRHVRFLKNLNRTSFEVSLSEACPGLTTMDQFGMKGMLGPGSEGYGPVARQTDHAPQKERNAYGTIGTTSRCLTVVVGHKAVVPLRITIQKQRSCAVGHNNAQGVVDIVTA